MKKIYTVVVWEEKKINASGEPNPEAGNLYFSVECFKTGTNIKSALEHIDSKIAHLCESKKQAESLREFWTDCEKRNRAERDERKKAARQKERVFYVGEVDKETREVKTNGDAWDIVQYLYKNELHAAPRYYPPRALAVDDNYICTYAYIEDNHRRPVYRVEIKNYEC